MWEETNEVAKKMTSQFTSVHNWMFDDIGQEQYSENKRVYDSFSTRSNNK